MASIVRKKTETGVRYDIQLSPGENESRPKISLGGISKKQADTAKRNIENLIKCKNTGVVISPAAQEWLDGIADGLRKRLETLGIIEPSNKGREFTVAEWVDKYIEGRSDVAANTLKNYNDAYAKMSAFFRGQYISEITVQQAKDFRVYLKSVVGLSESTLRRTIGRARQFFNAAIDAELISKNPFKGQKVTVKANESRFFDITPEMAEKVLDACPDTQWRLIFGLCRYGGLRCPSEVLRLTWQDIDFENDRFTVHASKTEHHEDSGIRTVPMFPELRPLFQDAFDLAKEGDVYCITRYRDTSANLRTQLTKIIKRAGLEPWPKRFQNLRSTRETELLKMTNGNIKAVCRWIGNSPKIALEHYLQVTEKTEREAVETSLLCHAEKRVQNVVQTTAAPARMASHEHQEDLGVSPYSCESKQEFATPCEKVQKPHYCPGLESNQHNPKVTSPSS